MRIFKVPIFGVIRPAKCLVVDKVSKTMCGLRKSHSGDHISFGMEGQELARWTKKLSVSEFLGTKRR